MLLRQGNSYVKKNGWIRLAADKSEIEKLQGRFND